MAAAPHAISESEVLERHAASASLARLVLTVVTPSGQAAAGSADEVTAPGLEGEFGVLPGHVPFLAALKAGVLSWRDGAHGRHVLAIDKGYLQVGAGNRVIILAEKSAKPESINVEEARAEVVQYTEVLKRGGDDTAALELARLALEWAQARVDAAERVVGKPDAAH